MADPLFELRIDRRIEAPPAVVWRALIDHATEWFTPRPWTTPQVDYDLRPGGRADVTMRSPEGETHAYRGVVLEVVPERRLVTTGALLEGWVPQAGPMNFVRLDLFEPDGAATHYQAIARHWDEAAMISHRDMGFVTDWGAAADQLAEVAERLATKG